MSGQAFAGGTAAGSVPLQRREKRTLGPCPSGVMDLVACCAHSPSLLFEEGKCTGTQGPARGTVPMFLCHRPPLGTP